jgi:beta-glucosidase
VRGRLEYAEGIHIGYRAWPRPDAYWSGAGLGYTDITVTGVSAPVRVSTGQTAHAAVSVPTRLLAYWDDGWQYEPGAYQFRVGTSATGLPLTVKVDLT